MKERNMKIGILDALNSPEVSHVTWHGTTAGTYMAFLDSAGAPFSYQVFAASSGELPPAVDACDAYLITGSVKGAYDDEPWIGALMHFIRQCHAAGKKMVGICFGHQLLAHALGGRTEKSEKGWGLGLNSFDVIAHKPWMNGRAAGSCALYFSHQDQVVALPQGAERLGGSSFCENAFFTLDDRVLGIQGHPEFTESIMQDLLAKPTHSAPPEVRAAAKRSLENGRPDNALFARWIVDFLLQ